MLGAVVTLAVDWRTTGTKWLGSHHILTSVIDVFVHMM